MAKQCQLTALVTQPRSLNHPHITVPACRLETCPFIHLLWDEQPLVTGHLAGRKGEEGAQPSTSSLHQWPAPLHAQLATMLVACTLSRGVQTKWLPLLEMTVKPQLIPITFPHQVAFPHSTSSATGVGSLCTRVSQPLPWRGLNPQWQFLGSHSFWWFPLGIKTRCRK